MDVNLGYVDVCKQTTYCEWVLTDFLDVLCSV